jgi:translation initiation factor 1 (eIF-1/SUI1)
MKIVNIDGTPYQTDSEAPEDIMSEMYSSIALQLMAPPVGSEAVIVGNQVFHVDADKLAETLMKICAADAMGVIDE